VEGEGEFFRFGIAGIEVLMGSPVFAERGRAWMAVSEDKEMVYETFCYR
jgi:hypothetical protein